MAGGKVLPVNAASAGVSSPATPAEPSRTADASVSEKTLPMHLVDSENTTPSKPAPPSRTVTVANAFEQPRFSYNLSRKIFEQPKGKPSLLPSPSKSVSLFKDRYYRIHQRLLRNEAFQISSIPSQRTTSSGNQPYKLTSIASLPGRTGSTHLLLGLLFNSPGGGVCLSDPSGTILVDLQNATGIPENGVWFGVGMVVLVDGIYEEGLGSWGVDSSVGGKFVAISLASPPCERREISLGIDNRTNGWNEKPSEHSGFRGGVETGGSEPNDPSLPNQQHQRHIVIMGEVNLDNPNTLPSLKKVLSLYDASTAKSTPKAFVLIGNFVQKATIGLGGCGSIPYKEHFDDLAGVLAQYPYLLQNSTFIFIPGDNDPWTSSYSSGATAPLPRPPIPSLFTSRVRRVFQTKSQHTPNKSETLFWASNPARLSVPGVLEDLTIFRDDISSRLKRNSLTLKSSQTRSSPESGPQNSQDQADPTSSPDSPMADDLEDPTSPEDEEEGQGNPPTKKGEEPVAITNARKLVKSVVDQGFLCPFPTTIQPILWDYASSLHLYPLPNALVLADSEADPFTVTYEGCHVMNPGRFVPAGSSEKATWIEYDAAMGKSTIREEYV